LASTWSMRASSPGVSIAGRSSTSLYRPRLPAFDGCYVGSLEDAAGGVSFFEEPVTRPMSSTGVRRGHAVVGGAFVVLAGHERFDLPSLVGGSRWANPGRFGCNRSADVYSVPHTRLGAISLATVQPDAPPVQRSRRCPKPEPEPRPGLPRRQALGLRR
jgi:hypothetical protein